jgi:flagellar protein FliO/FliZ
MLGAGKGLLGVVEASHIDAKRRLVLIRRDGVEHLLLLGPTSETVIETGIETGANFAAQLNAAENNAGSAP